LKTELSVPETLSIWQNNTAYVKKIPDDYWKTDGLMDDEVEAMLWMAVLSVTKLQARKLLPLQEY
jgi:hypothetical protein